MTFRIQLNQTQTSLRIESDAPLENLDARDVERLIAELARFRSGMKPEVPRTIRDGQYEGGTVDPICVMQSVIDQKILMVRHPGIGWLLFSFPEDSATKLGRALLQRPPQVSNQKN